MNGSDNHAGNDIQYYLGVPKLRTILMRTDLKINELKDTDEWNKYMYSEFLLSGRSDIMIVCKKYKHEVPMTFVGWHINVF